MYGPFTARVGEGLVDRVLPIIHGDGARGYRPKGAGRPDDRDVFECYIACTSAFDRWQTRRSWSGFLGVAARAADEFHILGRSSAWPDQARSAGLGRAAHRELT